MRRRRRCVICGLKIRRSDQRATVVTLEDCPGPLGLLLGPVPGMRAGHWWCLHPSDAALRELTEDRP
jgi:hypothetical protein